MDLILKKLFSIKGCKFEYSGPPEILGQRAAGVSIDTRTLQPNEIYFALRGERLDGHDFVPNAFEKQALAAVVERDWWKQAQKSQKSRPVFIVEDSLTALQETARDYRKKFSLPVLGLTGTNGKTTTKEMIAAVLAHLGSICKTEGNLNNHIGLPLSLLKLNRGHKAMVAEMGTNHFGEIARLCEIA
ncbi:hypothetical protein GWN42_00730, partial [candidate division KSB1 bacterium]|nr:hypothetical protein [candidate division KSB1 bacterium]NIU25558.1 hypothetical protein [candidate division KSB1 bacterium]NIV91346.1 hypothetical protein [candidate division KSB1 bacterium]NIW19407.1 hypothetical protein [candidate division KSB1 bacterium]NIW69939.1 hypothetical protein [candidate division KSB1 bacterium]